ncbi:DUF4157 domain-containing protein [Actinoplanes sp. NEAU-A12]|uniref:DUF4157 domain-containing protein n=1 Tax=Actinoplanes sandaracinus TaxID=3045177 RepID=A0ABT6WWJ3_9ACTN|nr:DUF4157 domain-containing protein [Actinoplanes sandaracinus]MDI6104118.1 DUF4157 domain-containing protein [Actinoplanes sandaracinus]
MSTAVARNAATPATGRRTAEVKPAPARRPSGPPAVAAGGNHRHAGPLPGDGPGRPLPEAVRRKVAPVVGARAADAARVHTDEAAEAFAAGHEAYAVTVGTEIYFAAGQFRPGTRDGDWIIAHEVAHVAQAQHGMLDRPAFLAVTPAGPSILETTADRAADRAVDGVADEDVVTEPRPEPESEPEERPGELAPGGKVRAPGEEAVSDAAPAPPAVVEAGTADAGPAARPDVPLMPEPAAGLSAGEQSRLTGVRRRAAAASTTTTAVPAAGENVTAGQAAVQEPQVESDARAARKLVEDIAAKEKPSVDVVELCDRIRRLIASKRPADEEGVIDSRPVEVADQAGRGVQSGVQRNVDATKASYGPLDTAPQGPAPPAAPGVEPIPGAAPVPPLAAGAATPDPVPADQVSLDQDTSAMSAQAQNAGLEKDAAKLVTGGPVAEARAAQGELSTLAAGGPAEALKHQRVALAKSDEDLAALQAKAVASLHAARTEHAGGVQGQQDRLKESGEALRTRLSKRAEDIYSGAQTRVQELLSAVPGTAMGKWTAGLPPLTEKFNSDLKIVTGQVAERHEGVGGFFVSGWDAVAGLPDWVTRAYADAEKNFGDGVCTLILDISSYVNGIIKIADEIIVTARTGITAVFTTDLPAEEQEWAAQQLKGFGQKLDALHDQAEATRTAFNQELIENAGNAVQAAREKIQQLRKAARGLWGRFLDAVGRFLDDPVKFIIDGLLEILGISPPAFWAVLEKIKQVARDIVDAPLAFANNLMGGIAAGFQLFFDNIGKHLITGLLEWLLSGLKREGMSIEIPKELSLRNVVVFCLQLLGISWARIRKLLVEQLGEKPVAIIEKTAGAIYTLATKGIGGIIEDIEKTLEPKTIIDAIIDAAIRFISETLIVKVAQRIILMLNPAGAILAALEAIYRVLKWVFTNAAKIFHLVEAIVNGLADVISGNVAGVAKTVEKALAMLVAPVIDFLADYLGLGGLPAKVATAVKGLQGWVEGALRRVVTWLVDMGRKLLAKLGIKGKDDKTPAGDTAVGLRVPFEGGGEAHELFIAVTGANATVMMRSEVTTVEQWLKDRAAQLGHAKTAPKIKAEAPALIAEARKIAGLTDAQADKVVAEVGTAATKPAAAPPPEKIAKDQETVVREERELAAVLKRIADLYGLAGPVVVRTVLPQSPVRLEPRLPRQLVTDLAEGAATGIFSDSRQDDTLIGHLLAKYPENFKDGTLQLPPPPPGDLQSARNLRNLAQRAGAAAFVRRVVLRSDPTGFALDAGYDVMSTGLITGPALRGPRQRIEAFKAVAKVAPTSAKGRFKPIKDTTAAAYPLSSEEPFDAEKYEKHFAEAEKLNREDVNLDLDDWFAQGAAGGIAQVSPEGANLYVVVQGGVYEDLVADTEADVVDPLLEAAVRDAPGVLNFMTRMASDGEVGSLGWDRFALIWKEDPASREWLIRRFRGAHRGMHEWIPSDYVPSTIALAQSAANFLDGVKWIELHHALRTETSWLIFDTRYWAKERLGPEELWVPQGHSGAVYIGGRPRTEYQEDFHNALRAAFDSSTGIHSCIELLYGVFLDWIWDGSGVLVPLHPGLHTKGGRVLDPAKLAAEQAGNFENVKGDFRTIRDRFGSAAT